MNIYFNNDNNNNNQNINNNNNNNNDEQLNNSNNNDEMQRLNPNQENKNKKDNFQNYDLAEGHEADMNDKLDEQNSKITVAYKNSIEFDMSTHKREIRMKKGDKVEMEKMRRWRVKINNIYITPLQKMIDPFLQFTIGGNFAVNVYKNKKGDTYKIATGKRGYTDKTEVIENVNTPQEDGSGGRTPFNKVIEIEMRMSYSQINKQKIMIELWEHNNFWMNEIHCYLTIPLIDIVNGNYNVGEYMKKKEKGRKVAVPFAYVEFNCLFQEIWDFNLYFLNWKASYLLNPKRKNEVNKKLPSTKLKIELINSVGGNMHNTSTSEIIENSATPIWTSFDDKIMFRGTTSELENNEVRITLLDTSSIINKTISSKIVGLRGVIDFEKLKTELMIHDKEYGENYPVIVQGFVTLDNKPRYKQTGQNVMLFSNKKYLVIKIMRVENIRPAETRGIVDSFISVEWSGMNQRTRTVKENNNPSFNEFLYFPVPLQQDWLDNIEENILKINEELSSKNEVSFNLMIEGDDNTYDNFGIGYFYLSEIKGGKKMQEKYFAEDLKKEHNYLSEKYTGKIKLVSAFSQSNNTFLHFEAWFLENFPPIVDFGEKKKKSEKRDKIPAELSKYFPRGEDRYLNKDFKNKIHSIFRKYSNYNYKDRMFFNLTPQDQYTNLHLLTYYITPITVPEKKYSKKDIETNPNFFDCNITTLDEVAHFVRCFPFPSDLKNDIWSSPDFMLKLRKGNVEEHAILMACLMCGLKKTNIKIKSLEDLNNENANNNSNTPNTKDGSQNSELIDTTNNNNNENDSLINTNDVVIEDNDTFPYENNIFVCQGKLKETKQPYTWVMSISLDCKTITFWDPKLNLKFVLKGRIKDPIKMKRFLNCQCKTYEDLEKGITTEENKDNKKKKKKKEKKQYKKDIEQIVLKGENEDSIVRYENDDDFNDNLANESQSENGRSIIAKNMIDDKIAFNIDDNNEEAYNFVKDDKSIDEEINKGDEKNFLPVDIFTEKGEIVPDVQMPYETIDLIFNNNNIYANCQYHDPSNIYYNFYEKNQWYPYFIIDKKNIWRGKFETFYSLSNFGPVYSPGLIKKMTDALIKEMRVGIAAARSGKNLTTKFKPKNEKINKQLSKYLDFLENRSLNRLSEEDFNKKYIDWVTVCKKYMPKFYRMEAQAVSFNFFETEIIRREITDDLEKFWYSKIKNIVFATSARVYGYPNQAVSVRIILAKFYRIPLEDITNKDEEKEYIEMLKEDPNKLIEEEIDSDEEEDKKKEEEKKEKEIMEKEMKEKEKKDKKDKKDKKEIKEDKKNGDDKKDNNNNNLIEDENNENKNKNNEEEIEKKKEYDTPILI